MNDRRLDLDLDPVSVGSLASLSAAVYFLGLGLFHKLSTYGMVGGSCVAVVGAIMYLSYSDHDFYLKVYFNHPNIVFGLLMMRHRHRDIGLYALPLRLP